MKRIVLLCGILLLTIHIAARTTTVTGVARYASNQETIPYCTISLCTGDSAMNVIRKFPSSEAGHFETKIESDTTARYCLVFEAIGLEAYTHCFDVAADGGTTDLGNIDLEESSTDLEEVSVTAQKPLVKMELDRLTYDTDSDPETKTSNALDLLRKVPLVTVNGEDKIEIKGSTNFKIYINGKPSAMVARNPEDVFRSLPASTIKRIEVITDPGAKYDAEGLAGILNIVTHHSLVGYNGSVNAGADIWGGATAGGYFTTKIRKFGLSANLNYRTGTSESFSGMTRENLIPDARIHNVSSNSQSESRNHNFYGSVELSYEFDSLNLLSLSGGGWYGNNRYRSSSNERFLGNDSTVLTEYNMSADNFNSYSGFNATLDYQHTFNKEDQNLTASYRYDGTPSTSRSNLDFAPVLNYHAQRQRNNSVSNGMEHTFQIDYTEPWLNHKHTLEVGIKYILRINSSNNSNDIFDTVSQSWIANPRIAGNDLNQIQHVFGAYAGYAFRHKWFSLRLGTRLEHTTQNVEVTDTVLRPQFTNAIPSVSLSFKLAQTQNLNIGYTQRLMRPGIWYLNPYWDNSDPLNIVQGNPDLDVERSHNVTISYGVFTPKFNFNISTWGGITNNSITSIKTQLSDSVTYTTYRNIGREASAGGNIYFNWMLGKVARWNVNANIYYSYYDGRNVESVRRTSQSLMGGVYTNLQFFLPWKLRLSFTAGYWSPRRDLQTRSDHYYYYGANLQRSFVKDRLTVSINAQQFAERYMTYRHQTVTDTYIQTGENRNRAMSVSFSISYRFGEMREQIRKVSTSISNDDVKSGK